MRRLALSLVLMAVALPAFAADVGVSINIGTPGYYGPIDVQGFPQPALIYPQPVIIQQVPAAGQPIYLRVPPGHAKHWEKHCARYGACGVPVYFVQDGWYRDVYVPRYDHEHGHASHGKGHDKHGD